MTRYLLIVLLVLTCIAAGRTDPHSRPFRPTARPPVQATPSATTTPLPVSVEVSAPAAPVVDAAPTPQDCLPDWSRPFSDENYQDLAFCRFVHDTLTGDIVCPPPNTVWIGYFRDAFCVPDPVTGATLEPPPPYP
jgi:hypothetical protein